MIRTIVIGSYVSVQGTYVKTLSCGRVVIRVGRTLFEGYPVQHARSA